METYFNTGWFIANRSNHARLMDRCKTASRHLQSLWKSGNKHKPMRDFSRDAILTDQAIMNNIANKTSTPVNLLDWRYNFMLYEVLGFTNDVENILSIHLLGGKKCLYDSLAYNSRTGTSRYAIEEQGFIKYSGVWVHVTNNIASHEILLRADGTVRGWNNVHFWLYERSGTLIFFASSETYLAFSNTGKNLWVSDNQTSTIQYLC